MSFEPTDESVELTTGGPSSPIPARRGRMAPLVVAITLVVLAVDQLTKWRALARLVPGQRIDLVGSWLGLDLVFNSGAALSIATGMTWVLTVVAAIVVVVVARASRRLGSRVWTVAFGLLLGGALGNLVDRFLRPPGPARGHVVDFIAYGNWFVGNVADIAIVTAALLVVVQTLRGVRLDGTHESHGAEPVPPADAGPAPAEPGAEPGDR